MKTNCALCGKLETLKKSHIIPKFVFKNLKKDSFTGVLRNIENINIPLQDGDKIHLLCNNCENLFSKKETYFSNKIFRPFKEDGFNKLAYEGNSLHYFITSVNWRTLYIDLGGFINDIEKGKEKCLSPKELKQLEKAERIMREYLLGQRRDIADIENHIFFHGEIESATQNIQEINPHATIQGSSFGYTVVGNDSIHVFANLTGIFIVTVIRKAKKEKWKNTFVKAGSGKLQSPQYSNSSIFYETIKIGKKIKDTQKHMSDTQRKGISEKVSKDIEGFHNSGSYTRILSDKSIKFTD